MVYRKGISIHMVYRCIGIVYRQELLAYHMFSYVYPMYILCFLCFPQAQNSVYTWMIMVYCITWHVHQLFGSLPLLAHLNAAHLLPAWMRLTSSCCSNKTHQVKHKQVYWPRLRRRRGPSRWRLPPPLLPERRGAPASAKKASNWCLASWPWGNPRNDFPAILRSKDQHLLNYINMNLCCKEMISMNKQCI